MVGLDGSMDLFIITDLLHVCTTRNLSERLWYLLPKGAWYSVPELMHQTQECLKIHTYMCVNAQWSVMEPYVCICVILHLGDQTNILLFRNCFCCRWNRCVHNQRWADLRTWWLKLDSECHWLYNGPAGAFEIQWMAVEVIFSDHSSPALYSYCRLST